MEKLLDGRWQRLGAARREKLPKLVERPSFVERLEPFSDSWYAFHWANEFFRTLKDDNGHYRGQRVLDYVPDKDNPFPGSTLHELYRYYRLIDPWTPSERLANATAKPRRAPPSGPSQYNLFEQYTDGDVAFNGQHQFYITFDAHNASYGAGEVGQHKTSMLQDLERGRPMEIDALLGAVVELAELTGRPTPLCRAVLALLKERAHQAGCYP